MALVNKTGPEFAVRISRFQVAVEHITRTEAEIERLKQRRKDLSIEYNHSLDDLRRYIQQFPYSEPMNDEDENAE